MSAWAETTLKKVAEKISYGYTASATEQNTGVKFLRITDIASGPIDWDTVPYCEISETDIEKCGLSEGEIVIARTGATVGYAKQIRRNPPHSVFASYLVRVRLKDNVCKRFVGILTESDNYKYYINTIAGGSAQPNANAQDLCSYPFYLPPIHVQQKVAAILSAYDELIENNQRRIALLEKLAEETYREWFVRLRFPGHKTRQFVKGVPYGWQSKKLGELVRTQYGYTASAETEVEGPKFLRITDIVPAAIDWALVPHCKIEGKDEEKYLLQVGDIVVARTGATVGYAKRINKYVPKAVFASYLVRLVPTRKSDAIYLGLSVERSAFKDFIWMFVTGAAQPQANATTMALFPLFYPSEFVLKEFNRIIEPMLDEKELLLNQTVILLRTRNLLLPRLISGKLSVENLDIQFPPSMVDPVHET